MLRKELEVCHNVAGSSFPVALRFPVRLLKISVRRDRVCLLQTEVFGRDISLNVRRTMYISGY